MVAKGMPAAAEGHRCDAKTRSGGKCGRPKGWGTSHPGSGRCRFHGGSTPTHVRAARRELAERAQIEAVTRLGLTLTGTNALDAMAEMLNHRRADFLAAAGRLAVLEPAQWAQRDAGGKFLRPSVLLEIYWRCADAYERHATECVKVGIAAMAADVVRRDAEQVVTLLQALVHQLGRRWDEDEVQQALVVAYGRLETA